MYSMFSFRASSVSSPIVSLACCWWKLSTWRWYRICDQPPTSDRLVLVPSISCWARRRPRPKRKICAEFVSASTAATRGLRSRICASCRICGRSVTAKKFSSTGTASCSVSKKSLAPAHAKIVTVSVSGRIFSRNVLIFSTSFWKLSYSEVPSSYFPSASRSWSRTKISCVVFPFSLTPVSSTRFSTGNPVGSNSASFFSRFFIPCA